MVRLRSPGVLFSRPTVGSAGYRKEPDMTDFLATVVASAAVLLLERLFAYLARTVLAPAA
jgi:hypothetical protein